MVSKYSEEWLRQVQKENPDIAVVDYDNSSIRDTELIVVPREEHKRTNKWGNRKTEVGGITFDSKLESDVYRVLTLMRMQNMVGSMFLQQRFVLQAGFYADFHRRMVQPIVYVADFFYFDIKDNIWVVLDAKGVKTAVFRIKEKMFLKKYPTYRFVLVTRKNFAEWFSAWGLTGE